MTSCPSFDVWPIIWTDYTYDSEHGIAEIVLLAFLTQRLVPSGNHGYIRNLGRSPPGTRAASETLGEQDIHATRLAHPCLVWKSTAIAREQKSQEWLANLCQEPDECEGRRPPCSVAVPERPWRPPYLEISEPWLPKARGDQRTQDYRIAS